MIRSLLPVLLLACTDGAKGTSIGNPTKTLMKVAPPGDALTLTGADLTLASVEVSGPNGTFTVDLSGDTNALQGIELELESEEWTSLDAVLDGPLTVTGDDRGAAVDLELEVDRVAIAVNRQPLEYGEPHVFELAFPGWLEAANAGWTAGEPHTVRPGDTAHDALVELIRTRSALLPDLDDDGQPDR